LTDPGVKEEDSLREPLKAHIRSIQNESEAIAHEVGLQISHCFYTKVSQKDLVREVEGASRRNISRIVPPQGEQNRGGTSHA